MKEEIQASKSANIGKLNFADICTNFKEAILNGDIQTMQSMYGDLTIKDKSNLFSDVEIFINAAKDRTNSTLSWIRDQEKEIREQRPLDNNLEAAVIMLLKQQEFEAAEKLIVFLQDKEKLNIISGAARYEHAQDARSKRVLEYVMTHAYIAEASNITIHTYDNSKKTYITFKIQESKLITTSAVTVDKQGIKEADVTKLPPLQFSDLEKFNKCVIRIGMTSTEVSREDLQTLLSDALANSQILQNNESSVARAMQTREQSQMIIIQGQNKIQLDQVNEENTQQDSIIEKGSIKENSGAKQTETNDTA